MRQEPVPTRSSALKAIPPRRHMGLGAPASPVSDSPVASPDSCFMNIITDKQCADYGMAGHPERPARILRSIEHLQQQSTVPLTWHAPVPAEPDMVARAHEPAHIRLVETSEEAFDGDTPWYPGIAAHALRSAGGAVQAMRMAREGKPTLSLLRPPGHHATRDHAMGFCYFNSIAIASLEARASGVRRVAVFDFDVHHGNGTEDIFRDQAGLAFYSVHQHPCYPGTGTRNVGDNCFNYPVAPATPRDSYRKVLGRALEDLKAFQPELVGVSAGFDAYARDPLAQETLEAEDFKWIGAQLTALEIPVFALLEGGYSKDLPLLIHAFLEGWSRT